MPEFDEGDTIRVLIATDNHVGFAERDPIRKDDSWRTFDEIMQLARTEDVDMVLLGGDLFHDNKPSRKSMYQVMRSLRKNCLGMKPCELEFLSDANEVFEGAFPHVNYQDPDINISIPVFSIHGNHDDPSGDGHYCSLDLLQVAGLVNYFGRVPEADNIHVRPVLLQKGKTKLALYGLSNVRDERMHRTFRDNKVKFYRPNQQKTDFFSLLAVHQNHYAHTATGYLPENMLPDFLDLVVWGHEHECLIDPAENHETGFHVMQPGSSVATSLVPGEAIPKQVGILSITGKDFQVQKIPLKTVRPFVTREIALSNDKRFKNLAKKKDNRQDVAKVLMEIVEEMIEEANAEWLSVQDGADAEEDEQLLPLIRLKVEYTAPEGGEFEVENPQRFSNRFAGKVANTNDVIYFWRKKTGVSRRNKVGNIAGLTEDAAEALDGMDTIKVEALVHEFFANQSLKILPQAPFGDAVTQFVSKDDKDAMETFVVDTLAAQVRDLLAMGEDEADLDEAMDKIKAMAEAKFVTGQKKTQQRKQRKRPDDWNSDMDGEWESHPGALEAAPPSPPPAANSRGLGQTARRPPVDDDGDDLFMDDANEAPARKAPAPRGAAAKSTRAKTTKAAAAKKAPPAKKAPARGRKKTANPFEDSEDEEEDVVEDEDEDMEDAPPARATTRRAQATRASARAKQTTLNFSQPQKAGGKSAQKPLEISDDEISEDDAFESVPATRTRSRR